MTRPPRARESVLDALETLLLTGTARAATMDAVAHAAGVSKGGLLYHFASKDALEAALITRTEELAGADVAEMAAHPEGIVAVFLRTSVNDDSPLDRGLTATSKLAQSGSDEARAAIRRIRALWADALRPHTRDETALQLVLLLSDGLYFNNALEAGAVAGTSLEGVEMDALIAFVARVVR